MRGTNGTACGLVAAFGGQPQTVAPLIRRAKVLKIRRPERGAHFSGRLGKMRVKEGREIFKSSGPSRGRESGNRLKENTLWATVRVFKRYPKSSIISVCFKQPRHLPQARFPMWHECVQD